MRQPASNALHVIQEEDVAVAKPMSPSGTVRPGQIRKLYDVLEAALLKSGLPANETQAVIEAQGGKIAHNVVADVRKRVDAISGMIRRHVTVDRTRSPQEVLDATGREQFTDPTVVESMPRGEGEKTEVVFFKIGHFVTDNDLDKEYELRGLKPCDTYSLAQTNTDDPSFADTHPNGTHWKDAEGKECCATFGQWLDERNVTVHRDDFIAWFDYWWFAGVRK